MIIFPWDNLMQQKDVMTNGDCLFVYISPTCAVVQAYILELSLRMKTLLAQMYRVNT